MRTKNFRVGDRVKATDNIGPGCKSLTYTVVAVGHNTIDIEDVNGHRRCVKPYQIELLTPEWREDDHKGRINIREAEEAMYYHTKRAGDLCYLMAAAVILLHVVKGASATAAIVAFAALVLAVCQNLWQGITLERFTRRLGREERSDFDTYPDHIANGGWVFYILKVAATLAAAAILLATA